MTQEENVPIEKLQALVEWWNAYAVNEPPSAWDSPNDAIGDCIDDLEAVIEDYE
jgi:hypothetical protein